MKYVRTKEGIYEFGPSDLRTVIKIYKVPEGIEPLRYADGTLIQEGDKSIVVNGKEYKVTDKNVADTIEELCDAFVMFCPNAARRKIRVYNTMSSISLYFKRDKRWNGNMVDKVYGAIWTDKGLIYVAKMNDKGDWELL